MERSVSRSYGGFALVIGFVVAISTAALGRWMQSGPSFVGLGDLPGGATISYCYGISDSGDVVAGESFSAISLVHGEGVRWERVASGWQMTGIGLPTADALNSPAAGVSSNGGWVVGRASVPFPPNPVDTHAYRWSPSSGFETLAMPSGFVLAAALEADKHGHLIVGYGGPNPVYTELRALAWPQVGPDAGQVQMIEATYDSQASRVDPQGKVVVGWASSPAAGPGGREAVYWTRGPGGTWIRHWLGVLPNTLFASQAAGLTRHGSQYFIVGTCGDFFDVSLPTLWRVKGDQILEMAELPLLPGCTSGAAYAICDDRTRIVGNCWTPDFEFEACVWDLSPSGSYAATNLQERLSDLGVTDGEGWVLWTAGAISGDGTVICGSGTNPLGDDEAWVAELP